MSVRSISSSRSCRSTRSSSALACSSCLSALRWDFGGAFALGFFELLLCLLHRLLRLLETFGGAVGGLLLLVAAPIGDGLARLAGLTWLPRLTWLAAGRTVCSAMVCRETVATRSASRIRMALQGGDSPDSAGLSVGGFAVAGFLGALLVASLLGFDSSSDLLSSSPPLVVSDFVRTFGFAAFGVADRSCRACRFGRRLASDPRRVAWRRRRLRCAPADPFASGSAADFFEIRLDPLALRVELAVAVGLQAAA